MMFAVTIRKLDGGRFFVSERHRGQEVVREVYRIDLNANLAGVDPGDGWQQRQDNNDYGPPDRETELTLEQVCHPVPRVLRDRIPPVRVVPIVDHTANRTDKVIRFPDGGETKKVRRTFFTKWGDGGLVKVEPDSEHARICQQAIEESGYSRRKTKSDKVL
jgi:hypothetical protein